MIDEILMIAACVILAAAAAILKRANSVLRAKYQALENANKDMSQPLVLELDLFSHISHTVSEIFEQTGATRFLLLSAFNGVRDLRFATAHYEQHNSKEEKCLLSMGATDRYSPVVLDDHYRAMLKDIETHGHVSYQTATMPSSFLRDIYTAESITESMIFFLLRVRIDEQNARIFYCSVATHRDSGFTDRSKTIVTAYLAGIRDRLGKSLKNHTLAA